MYINAVTTECFVDLIHQHLGSDQVDQPEFCSNRLFVRVDGLGVASQASSLGYLAVDEH
jgi:hypothetical protein